MTSAPASRCGASTPCRAPARSITRPGRTDRGSGPATPACGRRSPSILKLASFTCPLRRRPLTNTAAIVPATTSSPKVSSRLDLKDGKYKWHFQFVHHPLWDHDMSSAPLLMDVTIDGKPRKVVAVPSKQGWLYCFDRITGQPIWPIEEKPVPQSDMPGEKTAKTQPFPSQAARVLAHACCGERSDRLHARTPQAGPREPEVVPLGADSVRASGRPQLKTARRRSTSRTPAAASTGRVPVSTPRPASSTRKPGTRRSQPPSTTRKSSTESARRTRRRLATSRVGKQSRTTACDPSGRLALPALDRAAGGRAAPAAAPRALVCH